MGITSTIEQFQCATGNLVPVPVRYTLYTTIRIPLYNVYQVPVDPVIFSDLVPVRFQPNTDRIDRIWLSPGKKILNLGVTFCMYFLAFLNTIKITFKIVNLI